MLLQKSIPASYLARKVGFELVLVLVISSLVEVVLHFERHYLPPVPVSLPAFLGTAISLVLSFKLNQSYDRWWEARKVWGAIVNDSRTLVRQLLSFASSDRALTRRMAHRQIAWCYSLGQSLRGLDAAAGVTGLVADEELAELSRKGNVPLAPVSAQAADLSELARAGRVTDYPWVAIDAPLTRLVDSQGKAERIRGTVFPPTYRIFVHGFIYVFITLLSVALAEVEGIWQVAITTCVSMPMFLLEKTALHMQDPFANRPSDTAMTTIARTIDLNIREMLGDQERPSPLPDYGYYAL